LLLEYWDLCKSIKRFDLRFDKRKFASESASLLNLASFRCLDFVGSICNKIARFTFLTNIILTNGLLNPFP
jgi:hypothetical protein